MLIFSSSYYRDTHPMWRPKTTKGTL